MIVFLRGLFLVVLGTMLAVTSWASAHGSVRAIPPDVLHHPWFLATLADTYWAFLTFFVWVAWKESTAAAGALWLVAIVALGNIAMSIYMLRELFGVPVDGPVADVFTRRNPGRLGVPAVLAVLGVAAYWIA